MGRRPKPFTIADLAVSCRGLSAGKQIVQTEVSQDIGGARPHAATGQTLSDFSRLNYPFDSSMEIGIQSLGGGSARQKRHRSMRSSDGRSTTLRIAAVASKSLIASNQRRFS